MTLRPAARMRAERLRRQINAGRDGPSAERAQATCTTRHIRISAPGLRLSNPSSRSASFLLSSSGMACSHISTAAPLKNVSHQFVGIHDRSPLLSAGTRTMNPSSLITYRGSLIRTNPRISNPRSAALESKPHDCGRGFWDSTMQNRDSVIQGSAIQRLKDQRFTISDKGLAIARQPFRRDPESQRNGSQRFLNRAGVARPCPIRCFCAAVSSSSFGSTKP